MWECEGMDVGVGVRVWVCESVMWEGWNLSADILPVCVVGYEPPPHPQIVEAVTLTEIFRDNAHLCGKVTEAEVQHFINCTEKARNVKYIQFLQTVVVGAKGNRRVQEMVMNEVGVAL